MRNPAKFLFAILLLTFVSPFQAFGQSMSSVNADVVSACPTSGNMTAIDGSCRALQLPSMAVILPDVGHADTTSALTLDIDWPKA